jgi:hypothetical protein
MAYIEFVDRPAEEKKMPYRLQEQPKSVVPGRGGQKYFQPIPGKPGSRRPYDFKGEVVVKPLHDNPLTEEYQPQPRVDPYVWPPNHF